MKRILDQDYKPVKIDENGSGMMSVNQAVWEDELYQLERIEIIWFTGTICLLLCSLFFLSIPYKPIVFFLLFSGLIFYRIDSKFKYQNLVNHGLYQYEVYDTKVVRYTETGYERFELEDLKFMKKKKYGIVLSTTRKFSSFLNHENKKVMVIPGKLPGYLDIEKFFDQEIKKR